MTSQEFPTKFWEIWNRDLTEGDRDNPKRQGPIIPKKTPRQNPEEFRDFLWLVSNIPTPTVLEIGTGHGQTEKFYRELLGTVVYVSVDQKEYLNPTVCGDSTDRETIDKVERVLGGYYVSILFIDGYHGKETVRADFENYGRFVAPGGYVAFHDTHRGAPGTNGPSIVWNEIKGSYPSWDIHHRIDWLVKEQKDGTKVEEQIGIGVIQV